MLVCKAWIVVSAHQTKEIDIEFVVNEVQVVVINYKLKMEDNELLLWLIDDSKRAYNV